MSETKFEIYVPSPQAFRVVANGKVVENWRELQSEAKAAAEPAIRARWAEYWVSAVQAAINAAQSERIEAMMSIVASPDMYYPCPEELASKAQLT